MPRHPLSEDQKRQIRRKWSVRHRVMQKCSRKALAQDYGVSEVTIDRVVHQRVRLD